MFLSTWNFPTPSCFSKEVLTEPYTPPSEHTSPHYLVQQEVLGDGVALSLRTQSAHDRRNNTEVIRIPYYRIFSNLPALPSCGLSYMECCVANMETQVRDRTTASFAWSSIPSAASLPLRLGICIRDVPRTPYTVSTPSSHMETVEYHCDCSTVFRNGVSTGATNNNNNNKHRGGASSSSQHVWALHDRIGCLIDHSNQRLCFTLNGILQPSLTTPLHDISSTMGIFFTVGLRDRILSYRPLVEVYRMNLHVRFESFVGHTRVPRSMKGGPLPPTPPIQRSVASPPLPVPSSSSPSSPSSSPSSSSSYGTSSPFPHRFRLQAYADVMGADALMRSVQPHKSVGTAASTSTTIFDTTSFDVSLRLPEWELSTEAVSMLLRQYFAARGLTHTLRCFTEEMPQDENATSAEEMKYCISMAGLRTCILKGNNDDGDDDVRGCGGHAHEAHVEDAQLVGSGDALALLHRTNIITEAVERQFARFIGHTQQQQQHASLLASCGCTTRLYLARREDLVYLLTAMNNVEYVMEMAMQELKRIQPPSSRPQRCRRRRSGDHNNNNNNNNDNANDPSLFGENDIMEEEDEEVVGELRCAMMMLARFRSTIITPSSFPNTTNGTATSKQEVCSPAEQCRRLLSADVDEERKEEEDAAAFTARRTHAIRRAAEVLMAAAIHTIHAPAVAHQQRVGQRLSSVLTNMLSTMNAYAGRRAEQGEAGTAAVMAARASWVKMLVCLRAALRRAVWHRLLHAIESANAALLGEVLRWRRNDDENDDGLHTQHVAGANRRNNNNSATPMCISSVVDEAAHPTARRFWRHSTSTNDAVQHNVDHDHGDDDEDEDDALRQAPLRSIWRRAHAVAALHPQHASVAGVVHQHLHRYAKSGLDGAPLPSTAALLRAGKVGEDPPSSQNTTTTPPPTCTTMDEVELWHQAKLRQASSELLGIFGELVRG